MAGFQVKRFNWVRTPTFRESSETWRARRQAARENFEAVNSAVQSAFRSISADMATGLSSIAASTAVQRLQDAAKAKSAENAKALDTFA
jgi:coproporphyrinogen III oxidase-like Fe-S oxidoreductase